MLLWSCFREDNKVPEIDNIVLIGLDGLSPDGILQANTPVLDLMVSEGAHTFKARSVLPSSSSSNWASMIMGADTEQHGITSNGWEPDQFILPPVVSANGKGFPTIFTLFHDQRPELLVGAIYDWDGFGRLFQKEDVGFNIDGNHEDETIREAIAVLEHRKPAFTFIHLDHIDHAGHAEGHGTPAYHEAVAKADSLIGEIIEATKRAGTFEKTMFVISADHGGVGTGHGGETLAEMNIPFILYGKGIKKGYRIEETVYQFDNAATVAFAFGLQTPQAWIGRPVKSAFIGQKKPELRYSAEEKFKAPTIKGPYSQGGLFEKGPVEMELSNPEKIGEIRFTLDGSLPEATSGQVYASPIKIDTTTLLRAAIFKDGKQVSHLTETSFRLMPLGPNFGVAYSIFEAPSITSLNQTDKLIQKVSGISHEFSGHILDSLPNSESLYVKLKSFIFISVEGDYTFYTRSDDGSRLFLDGSLVVDNDGDHGILERGGTLNLKPGWHEIEVDYFNAGGGYFLEVLFKGPDTPRQIIPADRLLLKPNL